MGTPSLRVDDSSAGASRTPAPPPAATALAPERPIPPRFWWLKRISLVVGLLVLLTPCVQVWWGHEVQSHYDARFAAYRAAGEPATLQDLLRPEIPDEDNAAYHLRRAAAAVAPPVDLDDAIGELLTDSVDPDELRCRLAEGAACLGALHAARLAPGADWGQIRGMLANAGSTPPGRSSREHYPLFKLARYCASLAIAQHLLGDDAAAIDTLSDLHAAAQRLRVPDVSLLGHVTADRMSFCALSTIERLLPRFDFVGLSSPWGSATSPAAALQLVALRDDLLNERSLRRGWRSGLLAERIFVMHDVDSIFPHAGLASPGAPVTSPGHASPAWPPWTSGAARYLDYVTACAAAFEADWIDVQRLDVTRFYNSKSILDRVSFPTIGLLPTYEFSARSCLEQSAYQRASALAIALRLYELEHGRRPTTLNELVPAYIAAVPRDPFDRNCGELQYLPNAAPPVLYAVGDDGQDNHGASELPTPQTNPVATDWRYYLNGDRPWKPARKPATPPPTSASTPAARSAPQPVSTSPQLAPGL